MVKYKGTTLYPPAINDVLDNTEYVANYVVVVRDSDAGTDEVVVRIGLKKDFHYAKLATNIGEAESSIIKDLKDRFRARIRVAPIVEILPIDLIQKINYPAQSRKPIKFIDERKSHKSRDVLSI